MSLGSRQRIVDLGSDWRRLVARLVSNYRHESDSGLSPHQARRPALAAVELNENSERGLSGAHRQRESGRAALAAFSQEREHIAQTSRKAGRGFVLEGS